MIVQTPGMEINFSLWLLALNLAIFNGYSEAGENMLVRPPNLQCACSNDQLRFTCTVVVEDRIGATIWSGTAFTGCDGNRIQLRHSNENAMGQCNSGAISARSIPGMERNCATSELSVMVDAGLNNKTIRCVLNSNSGTPTIGEATITLATGPYQQAPGVITLTDVRAGELTFSWAQIDPSCPTIQYQIMSDCGNCSATNTSATCSNLPLSTTERNCTFRVGSVICGFSGPSSSPITVTLKVPDPPRVNLIPVYSSDSRTLTRLNIQIHSQMDSFLIYKDIAGPVLSYTIHNSSSAIKTVPASCTDNVCEYMDVVHPPIVCQSSSGDSTITVSTTNRLGSGPTSQPVPVGCTNTFITVNVDSAASTLTCQFQNNQNTIQKTCSVEYSVCNQEQVFHTKGNSTVELPNTITLQISLPGGSDCYTYTITANDGTHTVMVEGRVDPPDNMNSKSNSSTIAAAIMVPIIGVVLIIVVILMIIFFLTYVPHLKKQRTPAHEALSDPLEGLGKYKHRLDDKVYEMGNETDWHRDDTSPDKEETSVTNGEDSKSLDEDVRKDSQPVDDDMHSVERDGGKPTAFSNVFDNFHVY